MGKFGRESGEMITMDELIEKFKSKGIDEQDAEALAKHTIDLSRICNISIEQAFEKALEIITIAMAE